MAIQELWTKYESDCVRCGESASRGPRQDFTHDIKCWSLQTALFNLFVARVMFSIGIWKPEVRNG